MKSPHVRILQISDLHFSTQHNAPGHQFDRVERRNRPDVFFNHLSQLSRDLFQQEWPKAMIVSGDLVERGEDLGAFANAADFIRRIANLFRIPHQQVFIVPGNHDVNWDVKLTKQTERFAGYIRAVEGFVSPSINDSANPFEPHFLQSEDMRLSEEVPIELILLVSPIYSGVPHERRDEKVRVRLEQELADLNEDQRKRIFEAVDEANGLVDIASIGFHQRDVIARTRRNDNAIRIAVLHHHLLPDTQVDLSSFEAVVDSGRTIHSLTKSRYDLVLHGHKHNSQFAEFRVGAKSLHVYGAPSAFGDNDGSGGFAFIDIYGTETRYYAEIQEFAVNYRNERLDTLEPHKLTREGQTIPELVETCAEISHANQKKLTPSLGSFRDAFKWAQRPNCDVLFDMAWEYVAAEIEAFGQQRIKIRTPEVREKFQHFLKIANSGPKPGFIGVSNNDVDYWLDSEEHGTHAHRYCEDLRDLGGEKIRILILDAAMLKVPDRVEAVKKAVNILTSRDRFRILIARSSQVDAQVRRRDFAIIGKFAAYTFDSVASLSRGMDVDLEEGRLKELIREWHRIKDATEWDSGNPEGPSFDAWIAPKLKG